MSGRKMKLPLRVPGDPRLYAFARVLLVVVVRGYGRFSAQGAGELPAAGPAIVVANHPSDVDPILLGVSFPRTLHFMADVVQFRRGFVGPVIRRLAAFPIDKGSPDRRSLETALGLLRRGEVVALFPEGDLYRQAEPEPFGPGIGFLAALGVFLLALVLAGPAFGAGLNILVVGCVLGALAAGLVWWLLTRGFVPDFKSQVIAEIVRFYDPGLRYSPSGFISEELFRASGIFRQSIDRYRGEDCVEGVLDKTAIRFSELHAEHKTETTDSKGRRQTQWHTIFKGIFFIADFNKDFSGETVVLPDTAERLLGILGRKLQELNVTRGALIKLEDPEFEKAFVVYGTDQVEARYILSTALMQRILQFQKKCQCALHLSFAHSSVFLGISRTRNGFEPGIFRSLLDIENIRQHFDDIQLIAGIVEDLNLNTRIWTKT